MKRSFVDRLGLTLSLTIAGTEHKVPGAQIKRLELDVQRHGFSGELEFVFHNDKAAGGGEEDKLYADFIKPDLIKVALGLRSLRTDLELSQSAQPLSLGGLVVDKGLREQRFRGLDQDKAVLSRRYRVRFLDPARHLWTQHFPCELYTKKSMKDVIDAHKGDVAISYNWLRLDEKQPLIFLGLDAGGPEGSEGAQGAASFYDFVAWYADRFGGCLSFDYKKAELVLSSAKPDGDAAILHPEDVAEMTWHFPPVPRHKAQVLNADAEHAATKTVPNTQAASGVRRDYLIRTPISADVDKRVELETARLKDPSAELVVSFRRHPSDPIAPGHMLDFSGDKFKAWEEMGIAPLLLKDKKLRVLALQLKAAALDDGEDAERGLGQGGYEIEEAMRLELSDDPCMRLPPFVTPRYPRYVEGKIVSEKGEDKDETYQIYQDEATSQDTYKVKVPLWDSQQITLPFNPGFLPGHYYYPAYKNEKVLVALDFQRAWLKRFLDWRAGARLPQDGQGDNLMIGKNTKSNTSMTHDYEEDKPVFQVHRVNDKDTQIIRIEEGLLHIQVREDS